MVSFYHQTALNLLYKPCDRDSNERVKSVAFSPKIDTLEAILRRLVPFLSCFVEELPYNCPSFALYLTGFMLLLLLSSTLGNILYDIV